MTAPLKPFREAPLAARTLPATSERMMRLTREAEAKWKTMPQVSLETHHVLHAGLYSRTVRIPKGVAITGALIKVDTVLTIVGDLVMTFGDEVVEVNGYACLMAEKGRKQVMMAKTDCIVTMAFATQAKTVEEAENEFTDEEGELLSRKEKKQ